MQTKPPIPRAVLVGLQRPDVDDVAHQASLEELGPLVKTLGYTVVGTVSQRREGTGAESLLGSGKLALAALTGGTGVVSSMRRPPSPRPARGSNPRPRGFAAMGWPAVNQDVTEHLENLRASHSQGVWYCAVLVARDAAVSAVRAGTCRANGAASGSLTRDPSAQSGNRRRHELATNIRVTCSTILRARPQRSEQCRSRRMRLRGGPGQSRSGSDRRQSPIEQRSVGLRDRYRIPSVVRCGRAP